MNIRNVNIQFNEKLIEEIVNHDNKYYKII
jgi:hypothetical protein